MDHALPPEQSRKLKVHGMDIHKFGKVPSLTTRLHKHYIWQTGRGASLEGKLRTCTLITQPSKGASLFGKIPSSAACFYNFQKLMSVLYMFRWFSSLVLPECCALSLIARVPGLSEGFQCTTTARGSRSKRSGAWGRRRWGCLYTYVFEYLKIFNVRHMDMNIYIIYECYFTLMLYPL